MMSCLLARSLMAGRWSLPGRARVSLAIDVRPLLASRLYSSLCIWVPILLAMVRMVQQTLTCLTRTELGILVLAPSSNSRRRRASNVTASMTTGDCDPTSPHRLPLSQNRTREPETRVFDP